MATAKEIILAQINNVRETIENGRYSELCSFELTDTIYTQWCTPPEFRSKDVFLCVMATILDFAKKPDFDTIEKALKEDPASSEEFSMKLSRLKADITLFQDYYRPYLDTIDTLDSVNSSREALFEILDYVYTTGDLKDAKDFMIALQKFVASNLAMAEDVYRTDIAGKSIELPSFEDDSPMTWPEPCESELTAGLPSTKEINPALCAFDTGPESPLNRLIPHRAEEHDPILMKNWVSRLWGKAKRICDGIMISNKVRIQVPRLVMYPFYDSFFGFVCRFANAIEDYSTGCPQPYNKATVIKNIGGNELPWFMEKILLFAPREYFSTECNHFAYINFCRSIFSHLLTKLCTTITNYDTRDVARDARAVEDAYNAFSFFLCKEYSPCTRRQFAAQAKEIVNTYKIAFNRFADGLSALEFEMQKKKPAPSKSRAGIKHETFATPVPTAAEWSGVSEKTIRRYWQNPLKGIPRPPLNQTGSEEVRKRVLEDWGNQYRSAKAGAKEANAMNHAIPLASVGKKPKIKAGIEN